MIKEKNVGKNMKKSKWIILFCFGVLFGVLLSWWLAENDFPSAINKDSWLGFFGSYFGSIIGAVSTIFGVYLTLDYQRKKDKEDEESKTEELREQIRRNQNKDVLPYFLIKEDNENIDHQIKACFVFLQIGQGQHHYQLQVMIKNIGKGPAIEPKIVLKESAMTYEISDVIEVGESVLVTFSDLFENPENAIGNKQEILRIVKTHHALLTYKNIYGELYTYELQIRSGILFNVQKETVDGLKLELIDWKMIS